jgi:predicted dehydrogenase
MKKTLNIGLIGHKFMGKAHSNALRTLGMFFDPGVAVHMKTLCGVEDDIQETAQKYGWAGFEKDWRKVVSDPGIDVIGIASPGFTHADIAVAAAKNGKHILCEKPLANTLEEAVRMEEAARISGIRSLVNFVYRRVPAVCLAKQMIDSGQIGEIYHFKATYQQEWAGLPETPYVWRFDKKMAGAGSMADKGAHVIDLARFLVGDFATVAGASDIFVKERYENDGKSRPVTTDDVAMFIARFKNGAMGIFETSRIAIGHKNDLALEVNGSRGCIRFHLERLNELEVYLMEDGNAQGFKTILATEAAHPYMKNWWPAGHIIGWEHLFVHQYYEFFKGIAQESDIKPDFTDGRKVQQVITCVEKASSQKSWVDI